MDVDACHGVAGTALVGARSPTDGLRRAFAPVRRRDGLGEAHNASDVFVRRSLAPRHRLDHTGYEGDVDCKFPGKTVAEGAEILLEACSRLGYKCMPAHEEPLLYLDGYYIQTETDGPSIDSAQKSNI